MQSNDDDESFNDDESLYDDELNELDDAVLNDGELNELLVDYALIGWARIYVVTSTLKFLPGKK